jgi:N-acetylmuramoyl-L-alanine amidase
MHVNERKSPNWNRRPKGTEPSGIILHADASAKAASSVAWILNAASRVSYHYLVGRTGEVYRFVAPELRAWHAGVSEMDGVKDCNNFTIGVCFSNRNDGIEEYTPAALAAGVELVADLCHRFPAISPERIQTHQAVARPVGRKHDPGPRFPLADFLARVRSAQEEES